MTFRYIDQNGTQSNSTFDLTTPAEDIGGTEAPAARALRTGIRRIGIELEGMTREPDLGWRDPDDTNAATQAHRKFRLEADVSPRNLGMKGIRDLASDFVPPG